MTPEQPRSGTPIERLVRPFQEFARLEASSGILLIGCTVIALVWANSPWANSYFRLWHTEIALGFDPARFSESLHFWINDGLMAVFFLLVGLEIKREILVGELASFQKAALPIAAAIGGMLIPAGFYLLLNHNEPGAHGWGIPMATDIAFALGVLALLGNRVPISLKVFLAALAIADDIGAVLVIAFFYTAAISWIALGIAGLFFAALMIMNRAGARHPLIYIFLGIGLWVFFYRSGIHPTVSGVLLALAIPARQGMTKAVANLPADDYANAESPMLQFEHALTPWIKNLVMPLFALANAGVVLSAGTEREVASPVSLGIIFGLLLGKPIGIVGFSWLATRSGIAELPDRVNWRQILGIGLLGGIGFTMSLFIADLAFGLTPILKTAKIGILVASILAGVIGAMVLFREKTNEISSPTRSG